MKSVAFIIQSRHKLKTAALQIPTNSAVVRTERLGPTA